MARFRVRLGPTGVAVVALVGTVLGHEIEFLRVWGIGRGVAAASSGPAHVYLRPVGILLLAAALLGAQSSVRLQRRLEVTVRRLRRGDRRGEASARQSIADAGWTIDVRVLTGILVGLQLALYVGQENLEAHLLGMPLPGLRSLMGVHAWATVVHAGVALAVAALLWLVRHPLARLVAAASEAIAALLKSRRHGVSTAPRWARRSSTPAERWGALVCGRPPPLPANA